MSDEKKVTIGKREHELELPRSFTVRHEILALAGTSIHRAFGAALAVCVPRLCRMGEGRPLSLESSGYSVARLGAELIDRLIADPAVTLAQILAAGGAAFSLISEAMISEEEIETALGNSEGRETAKD